MQASLVVWTVVCRGVASLRHETRDGLRAMDSGVAQRSPQVGESDAGRLDWGAADGGIPVRGRCCVVADGSSRHFEA